MAIGFWRNPGDDLEIETSGRHHRPTQANALTFVFGAASRSAIFQGLIRDDELADHIVRYLKRRAGNVSGDNSVSIGVEGALDSRLDQWSKERRVPGRRLAYDRPGGASDDVVGLLWRPEEGPWRRMTCQTSLRNVDQGIRLLLDREDGSVAAHADPPFEAARTPASGDQSPSGDGAHA